MRRHQSGMTFTSFVIVAAVVCFFLFIGMKLFPMYQEFFAVKSSMKSLAAEPNIGNEDPIQIKEKFIKRMDMNFSETVKRENISFENINNTQVMHVDYEVRVPMVYNLDIVGKFSTQISLGSGGN